MWGLIVGDAGAARERHSLIADAFGDIAAGPPGDVVAVAHALTGWSMRLLSVEGAGVMMADDRGVLRAMAVSSDAVRVLEAAELGHGRGPCVDAHRTSAPLSHCDIEVADERWPQFGMQARSAGMRAAHAVPVLHGGAAIGVLNLFRSAPGALSDADAALARSLAEAAGAAVSAPATSSSADAEAGRIRAAFIDAAAVERATGMLAIRLDLDLRTAGSVLRLAARDAGQAPAALASAVVSGAASIVLPLSVPPVMTSGERK